MITLNHVSTEAIVKVSRFLKCNTNICKDRKMKLLNILSRKIVFYLSIRVN